MTVETTETDRDRPRRHGLFMVDGRQNFISGTGYRERTRPCQEADHHERQLRRLGQPQHRVFTF